MGAVKRRSTPGLEFLNEAGKRIGSTLELGRTASEIMDVAVPGFADAGAVYVLERMLADDVGPSREADGSAVVRRLAIRFADTDPADWVGIFPVNEVMVYGAQTPYARAMATVRSTVFGADALQAALAERLGEIDGLLRHRSFLAVPLRARGQILGVLVFSRMVGDLPFSAHDLALAEDLAARAAVCVDNARLYRRERRTASALQSSLAPVSVKQPPGLEIAHRYLPAGDEPSSGEYSQAQVGGDWYDVIPLPRDRVGLVIGDAMGHGPPAAAAMGQLRTAVRTLASLDLPPAEILGRVDAIAEDLDAAQFATCAYLVCDPAAETVEIAAAGHPPPVIASAAGTEIVAPPTCLPLGVGGEDFQAVEFPIRQGAVLVLYTDGLVESRDHDIDEGIAGLCALLADQDLAAEGSLEATADAIVAGPRKVNYRDDISVLLARLCPR
jgi:serine phosphatase RsbU (regulator of sigma subunit)